MRKKIEVRTRATICSQKAKSLEILLNYYRNSSKVCCSTFYTQIVIFQNFLIFSLRILITQDEVAKVVNHYCWVLNQYNKKLELIYTMVLFSQVKCIMISWTLQKRMKKTVKLQKENDYCCVLLCGQSTSQNKLWEHQNLQREEIVLR